MGDTVTTIDEVLTAARDLAREHGLASISMRDLAAHVGLHASSLHHYFPSKNTIYDALFAQGHLELHGWMAGFDRTGKPVDVLKRGSRHFAEFCLEDTVRYQLLFQRTIPNFAAGEPLVPEGAEQSASSLSSVGRRAACVGRARPPLAGTCLCNSPGSASCRCSLMRSRSSDAGHLGATGAGRVAPPTSTSWAALRPGALRFDGVIRSEGSRWEGSARTVPLVSIWGRRSEEDHHESLGDQASRRRRSGCRCSERGVARECRSCRATWSKRPDRHRRGGR